MLWQLSKLVPAASREFSWRYEMNARPEIHSATSDVSPANYHPADEYGATKAALAAHSERVPSASPHQGTPIGSGLENCRIAIIGAGPGGLSAAKYLSRADVRDLVVYEAGSKIGGLWCYENDNGMSSAYRTLHINTAKNITSFSDLPFDDDVQMFPDHRDMYQYLQRFVEKFDIAKYIRFNSKVISVRKAVGFEAARPVWEVETESGDIDTFDRVVIATGHLHRPLEVERFKEFTGEYFHSHYYKEPGPYVGKRICIVGIGNSAADIASDVCVNSDKTVIVARSGVMIQPKMIFGVPFTNISMLLAKRWIPARFRASALRFLVRLIHGNMEQYGFRKLTTRVHTTSNAVFVHHVAYNRIGVKHEIQKIDGNRIYFSDGTSDEFDVLIGATGYRIDLPFIDPDLISPKNNSLDLYMRIVPPGVPGLYFVGFIQASTSLTLTVEHQMRWLIAVEKGLVSLPTEEKMRESIAGKQKWIKKSFKDSPRHQIEEDHPEYFASIRVPNAKKIFGYHLRG
jgi:dimethylaniline monooxygenase (N-oxide forming)